MSGGCGDAPWRQGSFSIFDNDDEVVVVTICLMAKRYSRVFRTTTWQ